MQQQQEEKKKNDYTIEILQQIKQETMDNYMDLEISYKQKDHHHWKVYTPNKSIANVRQEIQVVDLDPDYSQSFLEKAKSFLHFRITHENSKKWITKEQILLKKIDTILDILLHLRMPKKKIQKILFEFIQDKSNFNVNIAETDNYF
jgi:hypothetical protein